MIYLSHGRPEHLVKKTADRLLIWDVSSLSTYLSCARKFKFSTFFNPTEKSGAAHFGTLFHKAIEQADVVSALRTIWDDAQKLGDGKQSQEDMIRSVVWYFAHYDESKYTIYEAQTSEGVAPAIELRFQADLGLGELSFSGRMDRIIRDPGGVLWIMDTKTTTQALGPYYWRFYEPDNQICAYLWAARKLGLDVRGVLIDAVQILSNETRFARMPFMVTDSQITEWEQDVLYPTIARADKDTTYTPNYSACGMYGGCPYREACATPPEFRHLMLTGESDGLV